MRPQSPLPTSLPGFSFLFTVIGAAGRLMPAVLLTTVLGAFLSSARAAPVYEVVKSIGNPNQMAGTPFNAPVEDSSGILYGTTFQGGTGRSGTIYRVARDGTGYQVIYHARGSGAGSTSSLQGRLVLGSDGRLYGTGLRTVFGLDRTGANFTVLKLFAEGGTDPEEIRDGLLHATDGKLYGVSRAGGTSDAGTIFRINKDGTGYSVLKHLTGTGTNAEPRRPSGPLIEGSDGILYGTSTNGGPLDRGTIFRINKDGTGWQVLRTFNASATSAYSPAGLVEGPDRVLYGLAQNGTLGDGALYKINRDGTGYVLVKSWDDAVNGDIYSPGPDLSLGSDGFLYGTCTDGGFGDGGIFRVSRTGTDYLVLHKHQGLTATGLLHGADGLLYGTANGSFSAELFRLTKSGTAYTKVWIFSSTGGEPANPEHVVEGADKFLYLSTQPGAEGPSPTFSRVRRDGTNFSIRFEYPQGSGVVREPGNGVILGSDGQFYGTSYFGGTNNSGSVFRFNSDGSVYTTLFSFVGFNAPGDPQQTLLEASNGFLYGVADGSMAGGPQEGVVFRIAKNGTGFTAIKQFASGATDLSSGSSELIEGTNGMLFGACSTGGPTNTGGVYTVGKDGTGYRVLKFFSNTGGGPYNAYSALVQAGNGVLYGVGHYGGTATYGAIYRINPDGTGYATQASFPNTMGRPSSALVEGTDGRLYGVTVSDNSARHGTLYAINRDGTGFVTVHAFGGAGTGDGRNPLHLMKSPDGFLYGAAVEGGTYGYGAIFRYGEAPEISARNDANVELVSGSSAISAGTMRAGTSRNMTFIVRNDGQLPLGPFTAEIPAASNGDFSVVSVPSGTLPPGGSGSVTVRIAPPVAGIRAAQLRLLSNDYDESPFLVFLNVTSVSPEIALAAGLAGAEENLTDGQTQAISFGTTRQPQPVEKPLTVRNTGSAPLLVSTVSVPDGYSLAGAAPFPLTIPEGGSATLTLRLDAAAPGTFTGSVSIESDDLDEAIFDFPVTGTVITPEIAVHDGAAAAPEITNGQSLAVNFGRSIQGTPAARTFTVANAGTADLLVSSVTVPAGYSLFLRPSLPFSLAPGGSIAVEARLDAPAVGTFTGNMVIVSDDLDEPSFSFPLTGEVYIPDPVPSLPAVSAMLNRQSGLREQRATVSNLTTATVPAWNLIVRGLPNGVELNNASSRREDGSWVIYVRRPMTPQTTQDILLEYFSPTRVPGDFTPQLSTEVVLEPVNLDVSGDAAAFRIDVVKPLPGGGVLIEFPTVPGRQYQVQYSPDGTRWQASLPSITAAANRTQWQDRGLPRTDSPPSAKASRFYRVAELAAP